MIQIFETCRRKTSWIWFVAMHYRVVQAQYALIVTFLLDVLRFYRSRFKVGRNLFRSYYRFVY